MQYTVDFFINKYEDTPEEIWITLYLNKNNKHCVLGLCGMRDSDRVGYMVRYNEEAKALISLLPELISINDGYNRFYQQPTPKKRVLAALYDKKSNQAITEAQSIINKPDKELQCIL